MTGSKQTHCIWNKKQNKAHKKDNKTFVQHSFVVPKSRTYVTSLQIQYTDNCCTWGFKGHEVSENY